MPTKGHTAAHPVAPHKTIHHTRSPNRSAAPHTATHHRATTHQKAPPHTTTAKRTESTTTAHESRMEVRRGVLKAFDGTNWVATVQIENAPGYMTGVPVSRGLASGAMITGRTVAVVFFDKTHPADTMVLGVF